VMLAVGVDDEVAICRQRYRGGLADELVVGICGACNYPPEELGSEYVSPCRTPVVLRKEKTPSTSMLKRLCKAFRRLPPAARQLQAFGGTSIAFSDRRCRKL
jgi:hypothetical protein